MRARFQPHHFYQVHVVWLKWGRARARKSDNCVRKATQSLTRIRTGNIGDFALIEAGIRVKHPELRAVHFRGANVGVGAQQNVFELSELLVGLLDGFLLGRLLLGHGVLGHIFLHGEHIVIVVDDGRGHRALARGSLLGRLVSLFHESHDWGRGGGEWVSGWW